ncbi:MAG: response regulator transcription factor [Spirochaetota bacterium]|nr:response regulator transcription factor [Spirochaetota bacterium]
MNSEIKENDIKPFIRVSIIDDDNSYRNSLKKILERDNRIRFHSEYDSGYNFLRNIDSPFQPDVCLVDVVLKDISGIECCKQLKEKHPKVHIVIMTSFPDAKTFTEARKIGADYLEKGPRVEAFIDRIIATVATSKRERLISLQMNDNLKFEYLELANELENVKTRLSTLTTNQLLAIKSKNEGKSEKEIAKILNVNPGTAHTHIKRALEKLNLPNLLDYILND